jgi:hypothetical protein
VVLGYRLFYIQEKAYGKWLGVHTTGTVNLADFDRIC